MTREALPIVEPNESTVAERRGARVHGLLLAAGESRRFGDENKLLLALDGVPVVRRAAETLVRSTLDEITAVLGHEADEIRAVLEDLPLEFVVNPDYEDGQGTSVRAGLRAAVEVDAVLIALGDMPYVSVSSVEALLDAYRTGAGDALAAAYRGERGNPVLFDRAYFDRILDVTDDTGARNVLLTADRSGLVETGDPGVTRDIDRPADLDSSPD